MDENLQCAPLPDTKDIIGSGEANESDDDTGESLPTVTYEQVCSAFLDIRSFFLCSYQ